MFVVGSMVVVSFMNVTRACKMARNVFGLIFATIFDKAERLQQLFNATVPKN